MNEGVIRTDGTNVRFITGAVVMKKSVENGIFVLLQASEKWHQKDYVEITFYGRIASSLADMLEEGRGLAVLAKEIPVKVKGVVQPDNVRVIGLKATIFSNLYQHNTLDKKKEPLQETKAVVPRSSMPRKKTSIPAAISENAVKNVVIPLRPATPISDTELLDKL